MELARSEENSRNKFRRGKSIKKGFTFDESPKYEVECKVQIYHKVQVTEFKAAASAKPEI